MEVIKKEKERGSRKREKVAKIKDLDMKKRNDKGEKYSLVPMERNWCDH